MTNNLPNRDIDIPIQRLNEELGLTEVDVDLLTELEQRPVTTGYAAERVGHQAGYVSQRLALLDELGVLTQLRRGYYEVDGRVCELEEQSDD